MSFPDSTEWRNKVFMGLLKNQDGSYYLSDPATGMAFTINDLCEYIEFHEK